ncbi:uncharacterized protein LAESUDRAFT_713805 [Laetiporus sulphureus 93-53]|uniref:Uncharacterized protein n=1 Tax=Laetiporus sulphureus 93-53 TaxID=1314785 RepID=A0A165EFN5_9APHY|nr:uncharacterized protein LAESUDRAFT_713805 [Laetiporus sulphureus 93-53]KZT06959.1 hypothetical protein LAESUDRAFT_713805 [Laetiporus sulphureus 93-53]
MSIGHPVLTFSQGIIAFIVHKCIKLWCFLTVGMELLRYSERTFGDRRSLISTEEAGFSLVPFDECSKISYGLRQGWTQAVLDTCFCTAACWMWLFSSYLECSVQELEDVHDHVIVDGSRSHVWKSVPQEHVNGHAFELAGGNSLGGSFKFNAMLYTHGFPTEYSSWSQVPGKLDCTSKTYGDTTVLHQDALTCTAVLCIDVQKGEKDIPEAEGVCIQALDGHLSSSFTGAWRKVILLANPITSSQILMLR